MNLQPFQRSDGQWDIRLVASNGAILLTSSQGFRDRTDAERGIEAVKDAMYQDLDKGFTVARGEGDGVDQETQEADV